MWSIGQPVIGMVLTYSTMWVRDAKVVVVRLEHLLIIHSVRRHSILSCTIKHSIKLLRATILHGYVALV